MLSRKLHIVERPINIHFDAELKIRNLLWSKGPLGTSYSCLNTEQKSSENQIKTVIENCNNVIFIRLGSGQTINDLDLFANNIHLLKQPVVLVTSDGDRSVPSSYKSSTVNRILQCVNIRRWYTQNYDHSIEHVKLSHIPIGFDLHTRKWLVDDDIHKKIIFMLSHRYKNPIHKRTRAKIFCESHNSKSHPERSRMYNTLKNNKSIDFIPSLKSFTEIIQLYTTYNFVLAPRGNGLDTHRLWELLLCGVIPIVKKSTLDSMYIDNKLPVVIINDWKELNENIDNKLQIWYEKYSGLLNEDHLLPILSFDYWLK